MRKNKLYNRRDINIFAKGGGWTDLGWYTPEYKMTSGGGVAIDENGNPIYEGSHLSTAGGLALGATAANSILGGLAGENETGVGNALKGIGLAASVLPGPYGAAISMGLLAVGSLTNAAFGSNIDEAKVAEIKNRAINQATQEFSHSSNEDLLAQNLAMTMLGDVSRGDVGSDGWFANKAKKKAGELSYLNQEANKSMVNNFGNAVDTVALNNFFRSIDTGNNILACGGNIFSNGGDTMTKKAAPIYQRFIDAGISPVAASGVLGNMALESSLNPKASNKTHWGYLLNDSTIHEHLKKYYNGDSHESQMQFIIDGLLGKLKGNNTSIGKMILSRFNRYNKAVKDSVDPLYAAEMWDKYYEISGGQALNKRKNYAHTFFKAFNNYVPEPLIEKPDITRTNISPVISPVYVGPKRILMPIFDSFYEGEEPAVSTNVLTLPTLDQAYRGLYPQGGLGDYLYNKDNSGGMITPAQFLDMIHSKKFGGELQTLGAEFPGMMTYIENGGTHEENPLGGVPVGVDPLGTPNLVEEGETIFNDYVFSNRLEVPKEVKKVLGLRGKKKYTFAEASKYLNKEAEERPNDQISENGLENSLSKLMGVLEIVKQNNELNIMAEGGNIHKMYKSLTGRMFNTRREAAEDNWRAANRKGIYADKLIEYTVKKGDSLWKISNENGIDLNTIKKLNPNIKNDLIHPGDKVIVGTKTGKQLYNVKKEWEKEKVLNTDNLAAIQSVKHPNNYIVIDKLNNRLNVYDKNNNLIYYTDDISTGKSGNDYNTITYVNDKGHIISGKGNESTPAGITKITGVGVYGGYPAFTRGRDSGKGLENIASSLHFGNTKDKKASNGCVRIGGKALNELSTYIGKGTDVYTLPEKRGSKFTVKDGKLNFTADNSYGVDFGFNLFKAKAKEKYKNEEDYRKAVAKEAESRKAFAKKMKEDPVFAKKVGKRDFDTLYYSDDYKTRFWDDYNVSMDKSYSPLSIISKSKPDGSSKYNNEKRYIQTLENSKERLQKKFNLDSDTYNRLASMALGIAEQETKFGTALSYDAKTIGRNVAGDSIMDLIINPLGRLARQVAHGQKPHNLAQEASRGYSLIKLKGDSDEMQNIYESLGVTSGTIDSAESSALATLARLAYMYNNEVKDKSFVGANNVEIDPYDALMYKWMGRNTELKDHTATPELNTYIQNVKKYQDNYNMYTLRAFGGNLYPNGSWMSTLRAYNYGDNDLNWNFNNWMNPWSNPIWEYTKPGNTLNHYVPIDISRDLVTKAENQKDYLDFIKAMDLDAKEGDPNETAKAYMNFYDSKVTNPGNKFYTDGTLRSDWRDYAKRIMTDHIAGIGHSMAAREGKRYFYTDPNTGNKVFVTAPENLNNYIIGEGVLNTEDPRWTDYEIKGLAEGVNPQAAPSPDDTGVQTEEAIINNNQESLRDYPEYLRYFPTVLSGLSVLTDTLGLTNKFDYTLSRGLSNLAGNTRYRPISYTPVGEYLTYKPVDTVKQAIDLRAAHLAVARNLMNISGGNRGTLAAGLLANNYQDVTNSGNAIFNANLGNRKTEEGVGTFNRGTDTTNALGSLSAQQANQNAYMSAQLLRNALYAAALEAREKERALSFANRNANLLQFTNNLGEIGRENWAQNRLNWLIRNGYYRRYNDAISTPTKKKSKESKTSEVKEPVYYTNFAEWASNRMNGGKLNRKKNK